MTTTVAARRPRVAPYAAAAVAVVLALFVALLATRNDNVSAKSRLVGKAAPPVAGTGFRGDAFDLDRHRGSWVVVNFFSTTCVPCVLEHPELKEFAQRHSSDGDASIVSVTFDDSGAAVAAFFRANGGDWPVLIDGTGPIAISYGVSGVPESFLVSREGIVAAKITGGVTADRLDALIAKFEGRAQ
ncbi:MAG TPA: TlpA disulfide reductase family protein [Acidimicrobiales bacterium]|jgi:cytochrome c biogenesis protein CcmG/thiol:disulfide interchange protein DsbE|nr:TlpA disulfide reductase family protein [Acidimicrobiales bacterium]